VLFAFLEWILTPVCPPPSFITILPR
jgi:hypothetical protein